MGVSENRDPNKVPQIVGSLLYGPQDNAPQLLGNSHTNIGVRVLGSRV